MTYPGSSGVALGCLAHLLRDITVARGYLVTCFLLARGVEAMGSGPDYQGPGPSSTSSCLSFLNFKRGVMRCGTVTCTSL